MKRYITVNYNATGKIIVLCHRLEPTFNMSIKKGLSINFTDKKHKLLVNLFSYQ